MLKISFTSIPLTYNFHKAAYFTEKFSRENQGLQWCMTLGNTISEIDLDRGNRPYASLHEKVPWLSKEGFLHFTSMRQFPNMVLRKLCTALAEECLPLQIEPVQTLLRQSLFQLGDLEIDNDTVRLNHRRDFDDIRSTCTFLLENLYDAYSERSSSCEAFVILSEMVCYFESTFPSDGEPAYHQKKQLRKIAKSLTDQAMNLAEGKDAEVQKVQPEFVSSFRSKQVILFRIAVLCIVHCSNLSKEETFIILKCMVRSRNTFVEDDKDTHHRDRLRDACYYFLTNRQKSYLSAIERDNAILTEALRSAVLSAPLVLSWEQCENSEGSFSAFGEDRHWYSINTLSGIVLVDGLPPNQLPQSITTDKRYQAIFGKNNFEVILKGGEFETVRPIEGCYYRFHTNNGRFVIRESRPIQDHETFEISDNWESCVELLDTHSIEDWGKEIPKQLKECYSLWISRKRAVIYFRDFDFRRKKSHFLYDIKMNYCHRLSGFDEISLAAPGVTNSSQMLCIHNSPILTILERFESRELIHTFCFGGFNEDGEASTVKFDLYRFGLTFTCLFGARSSNKISKVASSRLSKRICVEDSCVACDQIRGYSLADIQHLSGILVGFHQYFVLTSADARNHKVIIPFGRITVKESGEVKIALLAGDRTCAKDRVSEQIHFFEYDVHPKFGHLYSKSICSRIYLAALYLATSSGIPDTRDGTTGEEKAVEIVRQCWVNRPLSDDEYYCLENLKALCRGKSPTLSLLCHDLKRSSDECRFLHVPCDPENRSITDKENLEFAESATAYNYFVSHLQHVNPRLLLKSAESQRILGFCPRPFLSTTSRLNGKNSLSTTRLNGKNSLYDIGPCPIDSKDVKAFHKSITSLWYEEKKKNYATTKFPLKNISATNLGNKVYEELEESWRLHCSEESSTIRVVEGVQSSLRSLKEQIEKASQKIFEYITATLDPSANPEGSLHCYAQAIRFLHLVQIVPTATTRELASLACNPDRIKQFNPLLSKNSVSDVISSVIRWIELCVLDDKLECLLRFFRGNEPEANAYKNKDFLRELTSSREWDVVKHPYWLLYEMEQGIRIRPEQYGITHHLIHNHGHIVQLNMGLGKTRVILPMLILFYSYQQNQHIPRLCIPTTLVAEVCDYFLRTLSSSILEMRLFMLPFRREIEIDVNKIRLIIDLVHHAREARGFFVVAPEHRLSLILKVKELVLANEASLSEELKKVLDCSWHDIFDEGRC